MTVRQRDLFLVPFPFSDQSGWKVRPVLIISNDNFNQSSEDIIVCAITLNIKNIHSVVITTSDLEEGILSTESYVKVENILKVNQQLLIKKIGKLQKDTFIKVLEKLYLILHQ